VGQICTLIAKTCIFYFTLGFIVVEVVVVEVVENVMDELEGINEASISVDKMVGTVSTEGIIFSEARAVSGSVGCAPKVVNSSACIESVISAAADEVSLALAVKDS
jgi:hypothetical protein